MLRRGRLRPPTDAPAEGEDIDALVAAATPAMPATPTAGDADHLPLVEQILSGRVDTPIDYLASRNEWIAVLHGKATLDVGDERVELTEGDWVVLPANVPHRLVEVDEGTSWLAFHYPDL